MVEEDNNVEISAEHKEEKSTNYIRKEQRAFLIAEIYHCQKSGLCES